MSFESQKRIIQPDHRVQGIKKKERNGAIDPISAHEKAQGAEHGE